MKAAIIFLIIVVVSVLATDLILAIINKPPEVFINYDTEPTTIRCFHITDKVTSCIPCDI